MGWLIEQYGSAGHWTATGDITISDGRYGHFEPDNATVRWCEWSLIQHKEQIRTISSHHAVRRAFSTTLPLSEGLFFQASGSQTRDPIHLMSQKAIRSISWRQMKKNNNNFSARLFLNILHFWSYFRVRVQAFPCWIYRDKKSVYVTDLSRCLCEKMWRSWTSGRCSFLAFRSWS